jgi:hypothetical protein
MIGVTVSLTACNNESRKEISDKAKEVAIEYIKNEENRALVVEGVEFTSAIGGGTVWIDGYYEDDPSENVSVTVNYGDNGYSVGGTATGDIVEPEIME